MLRFTTRSIASDIPWQSFLAIKRVILIFLFLFSSVAQAGAAAGPVTVELETVPALDEITPLSEPTNLVLAVLDSERKPIPGGRVRIRLQAPEPSWFFSTDLPAVEGSRLIEMEFPVSEGTVDWEYLFPIRGVYRLEVTIFDEKGERGQKVLTLPIKESRLKLFYLGSFIVALFLLGFCMGWWLHRTRRRARGSAALAALASLWLLGVGPARAQDTKVGGELAVETAVVGKLSRVHWQLPDHVGPALLTLTITDLENEKRVLFLSRVPTQGKFGFDFQFTDGAQYRVTALAEMEAKEAVRQEKVVTATAPAPPQSAVLPSLIFFLGVVALGMLTGHISHKKRRLRMRLR